MLFRLSESEKRGECFCINIWKKWLLLSLPSFGKKEALCLLESSMLHTDKSFQITKQEQIAGSQLISLMVQPNYQRSISAEPHWASLPAGAAGVSVLSPFSYSENELGGLRQLKSHKVCMCVRACRLAQAYVSNKLDALLTSHHSWKHLDNYGMNKPVNPMIF